jgi:hypothetical protein
MGETIMYGVQRTADLATSLLHIAGLSGAAVHLQEGDWYGAITTTLIACLCVIMLSGALFAAAVIRARMREYLRKHGDHASKPADKPEDPAA